MSGKVDILRSLFVSRIKGKRYSYDFGKYKDRLNKAKTEYEFAQLSNLCDQPLQKPFAAYSKPRYRKDGGDGVYKRRSGKRDGIAHIMLAGDIMCRQEQQQAALEKYGGHLYADMFPYLTDVLSEADFVVGNLESTLSESAMYTCDCNRCNGNLNRNSPSSLLDAVRSAGFDMVVTANNHCLDAGVTGIYQTICHLKQYGLIYTGTFFDRDDRRKNPFVMVEIDGIKVAFAAYTYGTNGRGDYLTEDGKKYLVNLYRRSRAEKDIAAAKKAGAEFVIVYVHWGKEFSHGISEKQLKWAKELADAGADLIAGSHPHVTEPFGHVTDASGRSVPVIWSMGNLISSMSQPERRESVIIDLRLERKKDGVGIKDIAYIPCYTCIEYDGLSYTTVPLTDSICGDDPELIDSRNRTAEILGNEISERKIAEPEKRMFRVQRNSTRFKCAEADTVKETPAPVETPANDVRRDKKTHMMYCKEKYNMRAYDYEMLGVWEMDDSELKKYVKSKSRSSEKKPRKFDELMFVTGWDEETAAKELARVKEKFGLSSAAYYIGEYFRLGDEEIEEKLRKKNAEDEERMARMIEKSGWTSKHLTDHMKFFKKYYSLDAVDFELLRGWEMDKADLDTCSTLNVTRTISRKFNEEAGHALAKNKIEFNKAFKDYIRRKFWINDENATFESFLEFTDGLDTVFTKPVNLQNGKGAQVIKLSDHDPRELYDRFMNSPLLLVEECVKQCHELNELYDRSVNTIRLITVRTDDGSKVIASFFRVGANGSIVDNMASGGLIAGVDEETGVVLTGALDSTGRLHDVHPNTGRQIKGMQLPKFDMARKLCLDAIEHDPRLKYVGWDVAVCEDKAIIIEGNTFPDLGAYQLPFWRDAGKKGMKYKFEEYM